MHYHATVANFNDGSAPTDHGPLHSAPAPCDCNRRHADSRRHICSVAGAPCAASRRFAARMPAAPRLAAAARAHPPPDRHRDQQGPGSARTSRQRSWCPAASGAWTRRPSHTQSSPAAPTACPSCSAGRAWASRWGRAMASPCAWPAWHAGRARTHILTPTRTPAGRRPPLPGQHPVRPQRHPHRPPPLPPSCRAAASVRPRSRWAGCARCTRSARCGGRATWRPTAAAPGSTAPTRSRRRALWGVRGSWAQGGSGERRGRDEGRILGQRRTRHHAGAPAGEGRGVKGEGARGGGAKV